VEKKKSKIRLIEPTKSYDSKEKLLHTEFHCPAAGCNKRTHSISSHNRHMEICLVNNLQTFFGHFQNIYKARLSQKISLIEFQLYAINLLFSACKKLKRIAEIEKIDINSISSDLPYIDMTDNATVKPQNVRQNFRSPESGYYS
jgi:hypothetical protein